MARNRHTLAEISLRQQVRVANRVAFWSIFQDKRLPSPYWLGVSFMAAAAGAMAWQIFA